MLPSPTKRAVWPSLVVSRASPTLCGRDAWLAVPRLDSLYAPFAFDWLVLAYGCADCHKATTHGHFGESEGISIDFSRTLGGKAWGWLAGSQHSRPGAVERSGTVEASHAEQRYGRAMAWSGTAVCQPAPSLPHPGARGQH